MVHGLMEHRSFVETAERRRLLFLRRFILLLSPQLSLAFGLRQPESPWAYMSESIRYDYPDEALQLTAEQLEQPSD